MPEAPAFLDTNILLRHLLQDDPDQSPRATRYLGRVEAGEVTVRTADTVVFETVFTLQRQYRVPKREIRERLLSIIRLPGILLPGKRRLEEAFDLYVERNVSLLDAYHAILMQRLRLTDIMSFDRDFDRIPGVRRLEPE
jgi:predicted nucleic acid-binding protein